METKTPSKETHEPTKTLESKRRISFRGKGAGITNAYGRSKYVIEEILGDWRDPSSVPERPRKQTPNWVKQPDEMTLEGAGDLSQRISLSNVFRMSFEPLSNLIRISKNRSRAPDGADWSFAILRYFNPVGAP